MKRFLKNIFVETFVENFLDIFSVDLKGGRGVKRDPGYRLKRYHSFFLKNERKFCFLQRFLGPLKPAAGLCNLFEMRQI